MRRPKVHRVEFQFTGEVTTWVTGDKHLGVLKVPQEGYRTRCGITGGSELLKLTGVNNGSGRWCSACWPGATPTRRQRAVPDGRWW